MNENKTSQPIEFNFDINELNRAWTVLLEQYVMAKLTLENQNKQLQEDISKATVESTDLKIQLHKAQLDLIAAQAKQIIDSSDVSNALE